jgi:hypothetical protein
MGFIGWKKMGFIGKKIYGVYMEVQKIQQKKQQREKIRKIAHYQKKKHKMK